MAHTLLSKPAGYALADDVFYYQIQNTAMAVNSSAVWSITLQSYVSSNSQNIQLSSIFDANKNTFIEISDIVNAFVTTEQQISNSFPQLVKSMCRVSVEVTYNSTTYDVGNLVVLKGLFTKSQKNQGPISGVVNYTNHIINNGSFAGEPASSNTVYAYFGGLAVLSWYQKLKATATGYHVRFTYYLNNVFQAEIDVDYTNFDTLMLANTNEIFIASVLFELPTDLDYDKIEAIIIDQTDAPTTNPITILPLYAKLPEQSRTFVWCNAQGGLSSIQSLGDETSLYTQKNQAINSPLVRNNYTEQNKATEVKFNQLNQDSFETAIGYLMPQQKQQLRSILDTSNVWLLENDVLVSIKILQASIESDTTESTAYGAKLKWEYTYK